MKKLTSILAAILIISLALTGCENKQETTQTQEPEKAPVTALDKIKEVGEISIATNPDYPPFETIDDQGNVIGFDIDLSTAVAKELGVAPKFVKMSFDTIITAVKNGQADIGVSAFSITEERKQSIDFSNPYYSSSQVIMVLKDSGFTGKDDLAGKTIAVELSTTGADAAKTIEDAQVKAVDDYNVATMMLKNGSAHAVVLDAPIAAEYVSRYDFAVLDTPLTFEETAMVIKKGNTALKEAIDNALEKIKADGRYDELKKKWNIK